MLHRIEGLMLLSAAILALILSGCYVPPGGLTSIRAAHEALAPAEPPPPPAAEMPRLNFGASAGFILSGGPVPGVDLEATIRLKEFFAVRVSYGVYWITDYYGYYYPYSGDRLTVNLLLAKAVFSTPKSVGPSYRTTCAIGAGTFQASWGGGEAFVYLVEGGSEWILGNGSRLFCTTGLYLSDDYYLFDGLAFKFGIETNF